MSAQKIAALDKARLRRDRKFRERAEINAALLNLPADSDGIGRLLLRVQVARNEGYLTEREELGHERKLLAILEATRAREFLAYRRAAGERTRRGPQKPMSLAEQLAEEQSDVLGLEELNAKARSYGELEQSEEGA